MISQAELSIEVIVQFTCSAHNSNNFKLLASEVFFPSISKIQAIFGHQSDHSIGTTVEV